MWMSNPLSWPAPASCGRRSFPSTALVSSIEPLIRWSNPVVYLVFVALHSMTVSCALAGIGPALVWARSGVALQPALHILLSVGLTASIVSWRPYVDRRSNRDGFYVSLEHTITALVISVGSLVGTGLCPLTTAAMTADFLLIMHTVTSVQLLLEVS